MRGNEARNSLQNNRGRPWYNLTNAKTEEEKRKQIFFTTTPRAVPDPWLKTAYAAQRGNPPKAGRIHAVSGQLPLRRR
ncbi:unnamed protein product, partial [Arabidopsis halleri]